MIPVVTAEEMRQIDHRAVHDFGVPAVVLMENAGAEVCREVRRVLGETGGRRVAVFCGKGSNGGDGLVAARHLESQGVAVEVRVFAPLGSLKGEALTNLSVLQKSNSIPIFSHSSLKDLKFDATPDLIVDALLGTGFRGEVRGVMLEAIEFINGLELPTVAVDVPSGVESDHGSVDKAAVRAQATVTMGFLKRGLLFSPGREHAGEVKAAEIGYPSAAVEQHRLSTYLIEADDVSERLPFLAPDVYKQRAGKVFVIAGSKGMTGAATLTCRAALRSGVGMVVLGAPASLNDILEMKLTEEMTVPLAETPEGTLSVEAYDAAKPHIAWAHALAIGPGLRTDATTIELVGKILQNESIPVVLDADALMVQRHRKGLLPQYPADVVCTPHVGELAEMTDRSIESITADRVEVVRETAAQLGVTLLLKGAPTVIGSEDGDIFINSTGNAGMATAGSGDLLTGMIATFLAQGLSGKDAAICAVFLHGCAGDIVSEEVGQPATTAGAILEAIPEARESLDEEPWIG